MNTQERLRALEKHSHRSTGIMLILAACATPIGYVVLSMMAFQDPLAWQRLLTAAAITVGAFLLGLWKLRMARGDEPR